MFTKNTFLIFFLLFLCVSFSFPQSTKKENSLVSNYNYIIRKIDEQTKSEVEKSLDDSYSSALAMLNLSLRNKDKFHQLKALTTLADILFRKYSLDSALILNRKALLLAGYLNDTHTPVTILNQIGLVYWKKGNYKKAEKYYLRSIKINDYKIPLELSKSYNYLGLIYWKLSGYSKSLDYFLKSLKIKKQLGNKYEVALTLNNISNVFNIVNDSKSAIDYARKALKISNELNDDYIKSRAYQNLGVSFLGKKEYMTALKYFNRAIGIRKKINIKNGLAYSHLKRGDVYFEINQLTEAEKDYKAALQIMKKIKDDYGIASAYLSLGKIYGKRGNYNSAIEKTVSSIGYSQKNKLNHLLQEAHLLLSELYKKNGNYKQAFEEYSKYVNIGKKIDNIKIKEKFGELKLAYESEVKQRENELLKSKNKIQQFELEKSKTYNALFIGFTILGLIAFLAVYSQYNIVKQTRNLLREKNKKIEKQKKELSQSVATKDKMFSIIAHDLKSPFQSLHGYSELLVNEFNKLSNKEKYEYISNIKRISKNSTDLVENLLQWTRAQSGNLELKPQNINLKKITDSTIELAKSSAERKRIKIVSKINPNIIVYADENIIKTVLRNLLNNAIKFSSPDSSIEIFTTVEKNNIVLNVKDNGIGIASDRLKTIFNVCESTNGTDNEIGSGLGLALCKEFVHSYKGDIKVESKIDEGSVFSFTIPIYKLNNKKEESV